MDDLYDHTCDHQVDLYIITSICLVAYILSSLHTSHVHRMATTRILQVHIGFYHEGWFPWAQIWFNMSHTIVKENLKWLWSKWLSPLDQEDFHHNHSSFSTLHLNLYYQEASNKFFDIIKISFSIMYFLTYVQLEG